jgi:hypothetical protein
MLCYIDVHIYIYIHVYIYIYIYIFEGFTPAAGPFGCKEMWSVLDYCNQGALEQSVV